MNSKLSIKTMIVREATDKDIPQLVELRMRLFAELGEIPNPEAAPELRAATTEYFERTVETNQARSWVALVDDSIVAVGTLAEFQRPPYIGNLSGREAYLLNMFTLPSFRRRGIADLIFKHVLAFAKAQGYGKVWLHASPDGCSLYERHGFALNPSAMEWRAK
ncbi:MAG: GNAT family N-acetyltransferase [Methylobacter sp.]